MHEATNIDRLRAHLRFKAAVYRALEFVLFTIGLGWMWHVSTWEIALGIWLVATAQRAWIGAKYAEEVLEYGKGLLK